MDSILTDIKKLIGSLEEDTDFDTDIVIFVNSAFNDLKRLGVGPEEGFRIQDDSAVWTDFMQDESMLASVKNFIFIKVKLKFDPPSSATILQAFKDELAREEWNLTVDAETEPNGGEIQNG